MAFQRELLQSADGAGPSLRAASARGEAARRQASSAQAARLAGPVGGARPQGQLFARLAGLAQQSGFAPADAQLLQDALATDFERSPHFLSDEARAALNAPSRDTLRKARAVLSLVSSKLGLKSPSEGTVAHATGAA
ncbi:unnamed protein product, partial [Prorocentrum cordatum]